MIVKFHVVYKWEWLVIFLLVNDAGVCNEFSSVFAARLVWKKKNWRITENTDELLGLIDWILFNVLGISRVSHPYGESDITIAGEGCKI